MTRYTDSPNPPPNGLAGRSISGLLALALLLSLAGCGYRPPGKPNPADRPLLPAQRTDFDYLFTHNCTGCHGEDGQLGPAPPLNDPLFLAIVPDEELLRVITEGRPGTPMPAFARKNQGVLTEEQIKIIATGLKERWKSDDLPDVKLPSYEVATDAGPPSAADVERGRKVFEAACASCHGDDGQGNGPDSKPGGINNPALLTLISNQALRRIVITGRHDLGMPNFTQDDGRDGDFQPLTAQQIADVVALMVHWRGQPMAGDPAAQPGSMSATGSQAHLRAIVGFSNDANLGAGTAGPASSGTRHTEPASLETSSQLTRPRGVSR